MDSNNIESSSLALEASVTRIHGKSDLPFDHTSRRTTSGFLVDGPLLADYLPTQPSKRDRDSWIYRHGEGVMQKRDGERLWLCRLCYEDKAQSAVITIKAQPTTGPIRHLVKRHGFTDKGDKVELKRKRDNQGDHRSTINRQIKAQSAVFSREDWQSVFLAWAVADDVSLKKTTSKRLHSLLLYRCPLLKDVVPRSPSTTRNWKLAAFNQLKPTIINHLAAAKSRITLSFDA